jgi:hypothetical protein
VSVILKRFKRMGSQVMVWIELDQGRVQWRGLVNTVMNSRVTERTGNFLTS